ncbi:transcription factor bHLH18-like [Quillaja saponaria]|uniref:Transcription factor bHLH18-like n=1 Tax=Quillaja saponaria TaxID=32244 RepID=A0AAD7P744_QUISA|nr:transcription factor bHLH18-like [Quillaja saponaria]
MDAPWTSWLSDELERDDYNFIDHCDMNSMDDDHEMANFQFNRYKETRGGDFNSERPAKQAKTATYNTSSSGSNSSSNTEVYYAVSPPQAPTDPDSPTSYILSFEKSDSPPPTVVPIANHKRQSYGYADSPVPLNPKDNVVLQPQLGNTAINSTTTSSTSKSNPTHDDPTRVTSTQDTKKSKPMTRSPSHAQDHIMAERMRREKLTQRFIALSALIPGLKKMDKASVLADAIQYVKKLQDHVKVLEEQNKTKKRSVESVVVVKKSQLSSADHDDIVSSVVSESTSCSNTPSDYIDESLPEVEARVQDKHVLIRIHCQKQKGALINIHKEIDNLSLQVINSSVLTFGASILDITIIAQMEDGLSMTVKELAKNLRLGLLKFM